MYTFGKFLQAIGLILPLVGLFWAMEQGGFSGDTGRGVLMTELAMLGGGVLVFFIGTKLVAKAAG
ncbi:MAG: hypothetical protein QNJ98_07505 [Planctomycetota bacterium]|nr:hypothetical protein [Planctomycetota bacterium]